MFVNIEKFRKQKEIIFPLLNAVISKAKKHINTPEIRFWADSLRNPVKRIFLSFLKDRKPVILKEKNDPAKFRSACNLKGGIIPPIHKTSDFIEMGALLKHLKVPFGYVDQVVHDSHISSLDNNNSMVMPFVADPTWATLKGKVLAIDNKGKYKAVTDSGTDHPFLCLVPEGVESQSLMVQKALKRTINTIIQSGSKLKNFLGRIEQQYNNSVPVSSNTLNLAMPFLSSLIEPLQEGRLTKEMRG